MRSTIEESLKRASTDLQSSAALLNGEPDTKAKKGDPEQKHKTMVNKVAAIMKKLGAAILTTEGALPRLRRRIPPTMYDKLKKGLVQARDFKEESMDKFEDLKKIDDANMIDEMILGLGELHKELLEFTDALQEALKANSPIIKEAPAEEGGDPDARLPVKNPAENNNEAWGNNPNLYWVCFVCCLGE